MSQSVSPGATTYGSASGSAVGVASLTGSWSTVPAVRKSGPWGNRPGLRSTISVNREPSPRWVSAIFQRLSLARVVYDSVTGEGSIEDVDTSSMSGSPCSGSAVADGVSVAGGSAAAVIAWLTPT